MSSSGWSARDVRPVSPDNFHFTLLFLGETSDAQAEKVKEKLAVIKFEPFSITYTGVGAFPNASNARAIWVGVDSEGAQKLQALAGEGDGRVSAGEELVVLVLAGLGQALAEEVVQVRDQ